MGQATKQDTAAGHAACLCTKPPGSGTLEDAEENGRRKRQHLSRLGPRPFRCWLALRGRGLLFRRRSWRQAGAAAGIAQAAGGRRATGSTRERVWRRRVQLLPRHPGVYGGRRQEVTARLLPQQLGGAASGAAAGSAAARDGRHQLPRLRRLAGLLWRRSRNAQCGKAQRRTAGVCSVGRVAAVCAIPIPVLAIAAAACRAEHQLVGELRLRGSAAMAANGRICQWPHSLSYFLRN